MNTWLVDTPLLKMLTPAKAKPLLDWCEANDASRTPKSARRPTKRL
jgi:hypothetical protein